MTNRITILLFFLLGAANMPAQVMPRSGTHFTFGIPEGPDNIPDPNFTLDTASNLTVNITSAYSGRGIVTSPNGFCFAFTFNSDSVTIIPIPHSFMHLNDIGKTNKGLLIKTSQPVNTVFHDFLADAGEATQLYPDDALDVSYRITTWGLYDDPGEDNHSEFIITASQDNTDVTIVPSVRALGNHPANVPINVTLNRGECYIVKSDINAPPLNSALSNSTVKSSKPVSIISGVTCGYNPLGTESCNELLDAVLPDKYTDTVFYVVPIRDILVTNTVLFTSTTQNFFVFTTNGFTYQTNTGRIELSITGTEQFTLSAPAQCFLLSEGSWIQDEGDPTIVSVLPRSLYVDTMLWYSPNFFGQLGFLNAPFLDYVSVIYPKSSEGQVLLDGIPIASQGNPQDVISSNYSSVVAQIQPGLHNLTSPVPIYATVSGLADADGYSFIPGTKSPKLPEDTLPAFLDISNTAAKTCRQFMVSISSSFHKTDDINSVRLVAHYDPAVLTLISVNLGSMAQGGQWVTDTRIPGTIIVTASCLTPFTDSAEIITATFSTGPKVVSTNISAVIDILGGDDILKMLHGTANQTIAIQEVRDTLKAVLAVDGSHSIFANIDSAIVRIVTVPNELIDSLDLYVTYNHDLLNLLLADLRNTMIPGISTIKPEAAGATTDKIHIVFLAPIILSAPGIIARLIFQTYITDSTSGRIDVRSSLFNSRPCPLDILSDQTSGEYAGRDTCSSSGLRALMLHEPFVLNAIVPNPSSGSFTIDLDRHLFGEPLHISLIDQLGNEIWSSYTSSPDIHQKIRCEPDNNISNGSYFVRISGTGKTATQKIIIRN